MSGTRPSFDCNECPPLLTLQSSIPNNERKGCFGRIEFNVTICALASLSCTVGHSQIFIPGWILCPPVEILTIWVSEALIETRHESQFPCTLQFRTIAKELVVTQPIIFSIKGHVLNVPVWLILGPLCVFDWQEQEDDSWSVRAIYLSLVNKWKLDSERVSI